MSDDTIAALRHRCEFCGAEGCYQDVLDRLNHDLRSIPTDGEPNWRQREAARLMYSFVIEVLGEDWMLDDIEQAWQAIWTDQPPDA